MKTILTGDRPTGPLHIGHYVGSLQNRLKFQDTYKQYVMIADVQALTDNFNNPQKVSNSILEVALDYLAIGIDPQKTTIFLQSGVPEIAELTLYFMNLVTVSRLERNPTVKTEILMRKFNSETEHSIPAGFLCYPVNQAADISIFKADIVPAGEDQRPMIEQTNEIVRKFNSLYGGEVFREAELLVGINARLPGMDGQAKMSKSLSNAIYLSDSDDTIHQKVRSCYTDSHHLKVSDPGKVEGNVVFTYLDAFDVRKDEVGVLKDHYEKGGLGDISLKNRLTEVLINLIAPIRNRRLELAQDMTFMKNILGQGTIDARNLAASTLKEARTAMGIQSF